MTQIIQRNAHSLKNLINPLLKSSLNIGKLANKLIEWRRPWGPYGQTNWHPYKSLSSKQLYCEQGENVGSSVHFLKTSSSREDSWVINLLKGSGNEKDMKR